MVVAVKVREARGEARVVNKRHAHVGVWRLLVVYAVTANGTSRSGSTSLNRDILHHSHAFRASSKKHATLIANRFDILRKEKLEKIMQHAN